MEINKIKVGIIGANTTGWASRSHIPALKLIPEFELTAVSTTRIGSAKDAAEQFGANYAFDNEQELINCPDVDLVVIAVKVPYHYRLAKAVIEAGKMLYCEWPLGNGTKEAEELAALALKKGIRNFAGLQALSLPETVYLKKVIAEKLIGDVLSSSIIASGGSWGNIKSEDSLYMLDPANGATMLEIPFGHTVAAYIDVLGKFKSVNSLLARRRQKVTVLSTGANVPQLTNDQIVVSGTLENGTIASLHYRAGISAATNFLWEINGTKGDILVTGGLGHYQLTPVELHYAASGSALKPMELPLEITGDDVPAPAQPVRGLYYAYKAVLNDIRDNKRTVPDFLDGVRLHQFLDAIQISDSETRSVSV